MIVNTATVDSTGAFVLEGDNLPTDQRFYRIYLMKKQNTDYDACLYVGGDDHNFAHVILENGAQLSLAANPTSIAPFGEYSVDGDPANHLMRSLAKIVFPSFYFYRIKFPTELKFSENKLHTDLINFADTCANPLVALAAVNNTDFDEYFDRNEDFYRAFGDRLETEIPNSIYTKNYLLKVGYYANEESSNKSGWTSGFLQGILASIVLFGLWYLMNRSKKKDAVKPNSPEVQLTSKEKEILDLIRDGKSNKEIASSLFVEVSTVKTHINKIYSKIGASNRQEAKSIANQLYLSQNIITMKKGILITAMITSVLSAYYLSSPNDSPPQIDNSAVHWYTLEEALAAHEDEPKKIFIDMYTNLLDRSPSYPSFVVLDENLNRENIIKGYQTVERFLPMIK